MVAVLGSLRAAARPALAARLAVAARPSARAFTVSAMRLSAPAPPMLTGKGTSAGSVSTDYEQATGIERFELMGKAEGVDVFDMSPLEATRIGTMEDPIEIFSYYPLRHVGCTGYPADSHDTIWLQVTDKLKHHRCPECGSVYTLKYEPNADAEYQAAHHH